MELPVDTLLVSVEPRYPVEKIGVIGVLFGGDLRFDLGLGSNRRLELRNLQLSEMRLSELRPPEAGDVDVARDLV